MSVEGFIKHLKKEHSSSIFLEDENNVYKDITEWLIWHDGIHKPASSRPTLYINVLHRHDGGPL